MTFAQSQTAARRQSSPETVIDYGSEADREERRAARFTTARQVVVMTTRDV